MVSIVLRCSNCASHTRAISVDVVPQGALAARTTALHWFPTSVTCPVQQRGLVALPWPGLASTRFSKACAIARLSWLLRTQFVHVLMDTSLGVPAAWIAWCFLGAWWLLRLLLVMVALLQGADTDGSDAALDSNTTSTVVWAVTFEWKCDYSTL